MGQDTSTTVSQNLAKFCDTVVLAFFAEEEDRQRERGEGEIGKPCGKPGGDYRGAAEREPVAESNRDRETEAAPEAQVSRQRVEAQNDSQRDHYQARERHRVLQVAVDDVAARVEPLFLQVADVVVEFPEAEFLGVETQQAQVRRLHLLAEEQRLVAGRNGAILTELKGRRGVGRPSRAVPGRGFRMNDVVQAVVGTDLVQRHAAQRSGFGIEVIGGEETVAHAHPDGLVGEDALELAFFERDFIQIMRLAGRERHNGFTESEVEQRDGGGKQYHRHRHLEAADAKLLACEHFAVAVEYREAQQHAGEACDGQQLRNYERDLEREIGKPENAEAAVMDEVVEAVEHVAEKVSDCERAETYEERAEELRPEQAVDR